MTDQNKNKPSIYSPDISWLGRYDTNWTVMPLKAIISRKSSKNSPNSQLLSVYRDFGVIPKDSRDDNHNHESEDLSTYRKVSRGDLVLNKMKTWQGSLGVSQYEGIVSPAYIICKVSKKVYGKYLHYLLRSKPYISQYSRLSTGIRPNQWDLSYDNFKNIPVVIPEFTEQKKISDFLDSSLELIEKIKSKRLQQIKLLEEKRYAVITTAVTKGIDSKLEFINSDISWLDKKVKHWTTYKLKHLVKFKSGATPSKENLDYWDGDILWASPKDIKSKSLTDTQDKITKLAISQSKLNLIKAGSILIVVRSGILKRTLPATIVKSTTTINQDIKALFPNSKISADYLYWVLKGLDKIILSLCTKIGATVDSIEMMQFENFKIPTPPLDEQRVICDYLNREVKQIDEIINKIARSVNVLDEYKVSLITNAVTGNK